MAIVNGKATRPEVQEDGQYHLTIDGGGGNDILHFVSPPDVIRVSNFNGGIRVTCRDCGKFRPLIIDINNVETFKAIKVPRVIFNDEVDGNGEAPELHESPGAFDERLKQ